MKRSPLIILFVTIVIDLLGFGIVLPLLPLYVQKFGGTPMVAGFLTTSFSLMQFIFAPIWGRLSDIYGRRPLILLSLIGTTVAFFLFGIADSLWLLFAARIGGGILTAASIPTAQAYIADITAPEKRARGMALIGVAFGIGFSFGPWIGAVLGKYGLGVPAFFVSGLSCVNFIWSYFALPETHTERSSPQSARKIEFVSLSRFKTAFKTPNLGELLSVFGVANFAFALLESTFTWLVLLRFMGVSYYAGHLTPELERQAAPMVGPLFGIVGITIMFVQGAMMSGMASRIGERKLVRVGAFILAASMFAIGCVPAAEMGWLKIASVFVAMGNGMIGPSLSSLVSQAADPAERGSIMGVQQGIGSFARMIAPPLGTFMLHPVSFGTPYGMPYYTAAILMMIAFFMSLKLKQPIAMAGSETAFAGH